jgi:hypothetical protein
MVHQVILGRRISSIHPEDVTNHTELRQALEGLVHRKELTLRQIEKSAEQRNAKLRRSTLSDSLSGRQNFSRASVKELVLSCGEAQNLVQAWDEAWHRAESDRRGRQGHLGELSKLPGEVRQYVELGVEEIFSVCERYGVSSADIDMYMRRRAELRRRREGRSYWPNAPEAWKASVSRPCGDVSGEIETAIRNVLIENLGVPVSGALLAELTKSVLETLRQDGTGGDSGESKALE